MANEKPPLPPPFLKGDRGGLDINIISPNPSSEKRGTVQEGCLTYFEKSHSYECLPLRTD